MRAALVVVLVVAAAPRVARAGLDCEEAADLATFDRYTRGKQGDGDEVMYALICLRRGCRPRVPRRKASERYDLRCLADVRRQKPPRALIRTCTRVFEGKTGKGRGECLWLLGQRNIAELAGVDIVAELLASDLQQQVDETDWEALKALAVLDDARIPPAMVERAEKVAADTSGNRWKRKLRQAWHKTALGVIWLHQRAERR